MQINSFSTQLPVGHNPICLVALHDACGTLRPHKPLSGQPHASVLKLAWFIRTFRLIYPTFYRSFLPRNITRLHRWSRPEWNDRTSPNLGARPSTSETLLIITNNTKIYLVKSATYPNLGAASLTPPLMQQYLQKKTCIQICDCRKILVVIWFLVLVLGN